MSDTWYTYGSDYVVVRTGQPQENVEIGIGSDYAEAIADLEMTAMQSTGRDGGVSAALRWAENAGWIDDVDDLDDDDGPDGNET